MSWWKRQPAVPEPTKEAEARLRAFRAELGDRYSLREEDRRRAAEELSRLGAASIPVLIRAVSDPLQNVRATAAIALGTLRATEAVPPLLGLLHDPEAGPRRAAIEALGNLGTPEAQAGLLGALGTGDSVTRTMAADALGAIGDGRAVEPLVAAARDRDPDLRRAAVGALGRIRDPRAEAALETLISHSDVVVRERAAAILRDRGWRQGSPDERVASAIAAGDFDSAVAEGAHALKPLLLVLAGPRERRPHAAWALGRLGDPRAAKRLAALLGNKDGALASAARVALRDLGEAAAGAVTPQLSSARLETREDAAHVLAEIGGAAAAEPLLARLESAGGYFVPFHWQREERAPSRVTSDSEYRELGAFAEALRRVLERAAAALPENLLEQIADLTDLVRTDSGAFGDPELAGRTILERRSHEDLRRTAGDEIERRRMADPGEDRRS